MAGTKKREIGRETRYNGGDDGINAGGAGKLT